MASNKLFTFEISLSVLDHLGRKLYRNFATVLGEAISNSWDANANNVWIYVDEENNSFIIKDDGDGMTSDDFQNKFLKIGYSKRNHEGNVSTKGRPYIGRKGIGKLALLSCADRIEIISKIKDGEYVGGVIDNSGLDRAITEDLTPSKYPLEKYDLEVFGDSINDHENGTIIYFGNIKSGLRNSLVFLKKTIALYFRFSLLDNSFNIFLNGEKVSLDDLKDLAENTEFLWNINGLADPYVDDYLTKLKERKDINMEGDVKGFIASVGKPRDLKIISTDEKVGVDLFVNGRLRERDILKHIPTDRVAESYLYGQIHVNGLDDDQDRFTSSREGIVADDPKYKVFLDNLRTKLSAILEDWDVWRLKHKKEGDPENHRITPKERSSIGLYNAVSEEYEVQEDTRHPERKEKVDGWVQSLASDASFNFQSYAECFISENLIRKHIQEENIQLGQDERDEIGRWKQKEVESKRQGNISIVIRQQNNDLCYLDMDPLTKVVDPQNGPACGLTTDAKQYKPIRDALMHTSLLTSEAKQKLTTIFENIKERVKALISGG